MVMAEEVERLRAALAERGPDVEPVAWMVERQRIDTVGELMEEWTPFHACIQQAEANSIASDLARKTPRRVIPLYRTHPAQGVEVETKPRATEQRIMDAYCWGHMAASARVTRAASQSERQSMAEKAWVNDAPFLLALTRPTSQEGGE